MRRGISFWIFVVIMVIIIITGVCSFSYVPTGNVGIMVTFGKVSDTVYDEGLIFHAPWRRLVTIDTREQKLSFSQGAFSSDIQEVAINGSINLSVNRTSAMSLYKEIGENYLNVLVLPRIAEDIKIVFSHYTAEELIGNRDILSQEVSTLLIEDLSNKGINILSVAIEDIDFSDAFTDAVEAKQVAAQEKLRAETEQARLTMEQEAESKRAIIIANAEAEQAKIAAEADLEVVKIQAEAALYAGEKEAEMNKRISEALTPELIHYYLIKQWDGKLPTIMNGETLSLVDWEMN